MESWIKSIGPCRRDSRLWCCKTKAIVFTDIHNEITEISSIVHEAHCEDEGAQAQWEHRRIRENDLILRRIRKSEMLDTMDKWPSGMDPSDDPIHAFNEDEHKLVCADIPYDRDLLSNAFEIIPDHHFLV